MDNLITPENANVSFEIKYNSKRDDKARFIRSSIDYKSTYGTA
jgi:hypothetical protein